MVVRPERAVDKPYHGQPWRRGSPQRERRDRLVSLCNRPAGAASNLASAAVLRPRSSRCHSGHPTGDILQTGAQDDIAVDGPVARLRRVRCLGHPAADTPRAGRMGCVAGAAAEACPGGRPLPERPHTLGTKDPLARLPVTSVCGASDRYFYEICPDGGQVPVALLRVAAAMSSASAVSDRWVARVPAYSSASPGVQRVGCQGRPHAATRAPWLAGGLVRSWRVSARLLAVDHVVSALNHRGRSRHDGERGLHIYTGHPALGILAHAAYEVDLAGHLWRTGELAGSAGGGGGRPVAKVGVIRVSRFRCVKTSGCAVDRAGILGGVRWRRW